MVRVQKQVQRGENLRVLCRDRGQRGLPEHCQQRWKYWTLFALAGEHYKHTQPMQCCRMLLLCHKEITLLLLSQQTVFPVAMLKFDPETQEAVRDKNNRCVRAKLGRNGSCFEGCIETGLTVKLLIR